MGQTLTNGIYLPDEGEVRCYDGLAANWTTLDAVVGGYRAHIANENIHITSAERNKWDNGVTQAYVLRYANTSLTALGTVAFSALDNTDNVKIGDKVLDSEGKLFALTAVDTANSTATLSALLIDLSKDSDLSNYYTKPETDTLLSYKASDSDVVHKSGNETVGGQKTLVNLLPLKGESLGTEASNNGRTLLYFIANRDTQNQSGIYLTKFRQNKAQGSMSGNDVAYLSFDCLENSVRTNNGLRINFLNFVDDIPQRFVLWSGITERLLGTAGASWSDVSTDKINGLNPSSLGMPDLSNGIDISSYFDATQISTNTYTAPADGYISLAVSSSNRGSINAVIGSGFWANTAYGAVNPNDSNSFLQCMFVPILKNQTITVYLRTTGGTIKSAKFYPCLGNV